MDTSTARIPVTIVNHVAIDIACPPEAAWPVIVGEYLEGGKFRSAGYSVEPLDEPAAFLGGYRLRFEQNGAVLDERHCLVTEFDSRERRLSMAARYLSVPGGMSVQASYQAQALATGTRFTVDCHSSLQIERPGDGSRQAVKAAVEALAAQYTAALDAYLRSVKSTLESRA